MNLSNIKYFSTVNGDGIRTAVFVSGCNIHCKGCFNKEAWDFNYGFEMTDDVINKIIDSTRDEYIDGITVLGGEPFDPKNQEGVLKLLTEYRKVYGNTKTIWIYSGYTYDTIPKTDYTSRIFAAVDRLVDGPFVLSERNPDLAFRGSSNQRILSMNQ